MSTYYYIFAEAQVDGKWMNLNPILYAHNGEYKSSEITYFTHSSYAEVYYALSDDKRPTNRDTFLSLSTFFQSFNHEHIPSLLHLHS